MSSIGFEDLELLFSPSRSRFYFAVTNREPMRSFFQKHIDPGKLLVMNGEGEGGKIIEEESFIQMAKEAGSFWLYTHSSPKIETWSHEHSIPVISPSYELQQKLEDKIFFETFAKQNDLPTPPGRILNTMEEAMEWKEFPAVLQRPRSHGGQGTFYVESREQWEEKIRANANGFPLLVRRYMDGISLGVTLLITTNKVIFSALREQMIFIKEEALNKYLGIQWIKTNQIGEMGIQKIEAMLTWLAMGLQIMGYRGSAGIDFIWDGENPYLLECNPRSALSSIQLSQNASLFHGLNFCDEMITAFKRDSLSMNCPMLSHSEFEGTTLDLDFFGMPYYGRALSDPLPIGVYKLDDKGEMKFKENRLDFSEPDEVFMYSAFFSNEALTKDTDMGLAMTTYPIKENPVFLEMIAQFFDKKLKGRK